MEKILLEIEEEPIRLDHILQMSGIAISGGQAGQIIKQGLVKINSQIVNEKRKKVFIKDEVIFNDNYLLELRFKI